MVAALTWSKKGMEERRPVMLRVGERGQALKDWFVNAVDADTEAFNAVIAARRSPKKTDEERRARDAAIELANQEATRVPLRVLERCVETLDLAAEVAAQGNPASVSDVGVAGACALAAAEGAALNVRINLPGLTDRKVADEIASRQVELLHESRERAERVRGIVDQVLERSSG
jgi:glutamate formiminotransferase/formiminotetrahydrofolate cyclodeaminase